ARRSNRCLACAPCQGTVQPISERPDHAAVAQRQSNRFVSDRLTVRIRPAAPADFRPRNTAFAAVIPLSFPRKREPITTALWNMGPRFRGDDKRDIAFPPLIPAQAGIQGLRPVALGPRWSSPPRKRGRGRADKIILAGQRQATTAASTRGRASAPRR